MSTDIKIEDLKIGDCLSSYFKTVNTQTLVGSGDIKVTNWISNVQILKPKFTEKTHVRLFISSSIDFSECIKIDSKDMPEAFYGLIHHKSDDIEWIRCPDEGFSVEFNDKPIMIDLEHILKTTGFKYENSLYVKYLHYWTDGSGNLHQSDMNSLVIPSSTEVGANAQAAYVTKVSGTKEVIEPTLNSYDMYSIDGDHILNFKSLDENISIMLADFNPSFIQTGTYQAIASTSGKKVTVTFYYDDGSGPQSFDPAKEIELQPNSFYEIEFKHGHVFIERALA